MCCSMAVTVDRERAMERESVGNGSHCSSDVMAQTPPTPQARLSFSSLLFPLLTTSPLHFFHPSLVFIFISLSCLTVIQCPCLSLLSGHTFTIVVEIYTCKSMHVLHTVYIVMLPQSKHQRYISTLETMLPKNGETSLSFAKARKQQLMPKSHRKAFAYPY